MNSLTLIITAVIALALGGGVGFAVRKFLVSSRQQNAEAKADHMLTEAKTKQKELLLESQEKALAITESAKKEERERRGRILELEERVSKREESLDRKLESLEHKQNLLNDEAKKLKDTRHELDTIKQRQLETLEKVANLTREKAREVLLEMTEKDMKERIVERVQKMAHMEKDELDKKARELLSLAVQRVVMNHTSETTSTTVAIPSDDMKGRIIGREGRNIRTLEQLTGVEIVIDDTPGAIVISGFSPVRRHIAKKALEKLMADGRIHPGRIEEMVEAAKEEIGEDIKEAGEAVVYDLGITDLDPKLVHLIGRLKYRSSYGQNVLKHSLEVAHLAGIIAEELGADVNVAKRGGLLHDIGKAVDHEIEGTHVQIGINILKKFHVDQRVIAAMQSHHEEYPFESTEAYVVQAADSISGSRPGARRDTYENYIKRLSDLEAIATSFEGIDKAYAIQAGREIRVFVAPQKIDDLAALKLARDIADKIQAELKYPGEIKVNVIRETRSVEYAR